MTSLGSRIRALRKKKKLTLESLAGNQLTKGMLSLIENDKAKPSMESLNYIAKRLDVEVNELLQEISVTELREILNDVSPQFEQKNYKNVYEKLNSIIKLELPLSIEAGKILTWFGMSSFYLGKNDWNIYLEKAEQIYLSLNLFNEATKIHSFIMYTKMKNFDYEDALRFVREKRKFFKEKNITLNVLAELDLSYNEVILLFAIGKYDEAANQLTNAISLSKEKNILYRIDHLYRVAYFYAMINGVDEDMNYYLHKLSLLAEFLESEELKWVVYFFKAEYLLEISHQYDKALTYIEQLSNIDSIDPSFEMYYSIVKGKYLFRMNQYEEALQYLLKIQDYPNDHVHPFDLSIHYVIYAYISLCYYRLNKFEKAMNYIDIAKKYMEPLPTTPYKRFVEETFHIVKTT